MAQPAEAKPLELSRYCVPFTPFKGKLEDATVCLVSTAGVRGKDDAPFDVDGRHELARHLRATRRRRTSATTTRTTTTPASTGT